MLQAPLGVDSCYSHVSDHLIQKVNKFLGTIPVFWGRYFATQGEDEYDASTENPLLAQANIRLLPIARRTLRVSGGTELGAIDAQACTDDLFTAFPIDYLAEQSREFMVFLNVETSPTLLKEYYLGWATTLIEYSRRCSDHAITLRPCIYADAGESNNNTWIALTTAVHEGAACDGIWVAHYLNPKSVPLTLEWDSQLLTPPVKPPCEILIWQYKMNTNLINPDIDIDKDLLSKLILPPSNQGMPHVQPA